jgi:hypothetical protein
VLFLRYLQGYTAAEIGQELGLSAGHVRVLQLRALRRAALLEAEERSLSQMNEPANEPVTTYTEQGQRVLDLAKEEASSLVQSPLYRGRAPLARHPARRGCSGSPDRARNDT